MLDNRVQLPWVDNLLTDFQQRMADDKMPHALLIHGNQGIGKRYLANAIGALVLCQKPQQGQACGQCKTCYLRQAGTHPDCFDIGVEEGKKQILIEQIRSLITPANTGISKLYSKAVQMGGYGAWKVVVIEPAEAMNTNTANSLLKILEEPPANTLFILIGNYLQLVLPTIRSRCQQFLLPLPTEAEAKSWLNAQPAFSKGSIDENLLQHYLDKPLELIRLLENDLLQQRLNIKTICQQILLPEQSVSEIASELATDKDNIVDYINWFSEEIHQLLKAKLLTGESRSKADFLKLNRMLDIIQQHTREAHYGSINQRLFWETLLLQWQRYNR